MYTQNIILPPYVSLFFFALKSVTFEPLSINSLTKQFIDNNEGKTHRHNRSYYNNPRDLFIETKKIS